jgi:hypothetical protein
MSYRDSIDGLQDQINELELSYQAFDDPDIPYEENPWKHMLDNIDSEIKELEQRQRELNSYS